MQLHPASLLVGAALAIGVGLLSAQQIVGSPSVEVVIRDSVPLEVSVIDPATSWKEGERVWVPKNSTYNVPVGKCLLVTNAWWGNFGGADGWVRVDGIQIARFGTISQGGIRADQQWPEGLPVMGGSVITTTQGNVVGFLVDA